MRRTAFIAAICLAVACGTEPAAPPTDFPGGTTSVPGGMASVLGTCANTIPGPDAFVKLDSWTCGSEILVKGQDATLVTAVTSAIGTWNGVYGHNGLPKFVTLATQTKTPAFTINVNWGATTGAYYCGETNPSTRQITINRAPTSTSCGGEDSTNPVQVGSLSRLIAHELAHAIGFKHLSQLGSVPASNNCVASLPQGGGLNGGLCQHEILHVQYQYAVYPTFVPLSTYIATGLDITGTTTATPPDSKALTAFPAWDVTPPGTVKYSWTSNATGVATVSPSITATNTVTAVSPGTATISARVTGTTVTGTNTLVLDLSSGDVLFTVNPPPPPPPTGLNATSITASAATIRWTNGAADATTNLYYRKTGLSTWTDSVTGIAAGTTSRQLTSLTGGTSYDVRAKHVRAGQSSTFTSTIQFTTLAAPLPTITNFVVVVCNMQVVGLKTFNYFTMTWNATPDQTTGSYQIAEYTSNNVALAAVATTVPATSETGVVGGYLKSTVLSNRWFWVRYTGASGTTPWVPLTPNPLATNLCLQ